MPTTGPVPRSSFLLPTDEVRCFGGGFYRGFFAHHHIEQHFEQTAFISFRELNPKITPASGFRSSFECAQIVITRLFDLRHHIAYWWPRFTAIFSLPRHAATRHFQMKLAAFYLLGHPNWHHPRREEEIRTTEHAILRCLARQYARGSSPKALGLQSAWYDAAATEMLAEFVCTLAHESLDITRSRGFNWVLSAVAWPFCEAFCQGPYRILSFDTAQLIRREPGIGSPYTIASTGVYLLAPWGDPMRLCGRHQNVVARMLARKPEAIRAVMR